MRDEHEQRAEGDGAPGVSLAAARRLFSSLHTIEVAVDDEQGFPRVRGYTISRRVGRGGGGEVYLGVRDGSDRPVAIKILNIGAGDAASSERAWRELEVLSDCRIAAVPRVLDYGVCEGAMAGCLFIVSEYVDGLPLDEYAERHDLDRRQRVELLADAARAVHSLHEYGVIHRDIKPANILVDGAGRPMIIDLGIASLVTGDPVRTLTADGAPIGSPAFMSPEQARGDRRSVSTRSDVYGLGATAYLLLTGSTPHDTDTTIHEAIRRVAQDPPRTPGSLDPSLDRSLAAILAKAVAPGPERRYSSAAAMEADLRRWLAGQSVEAHPPGLWRRVASVLLAHPILATVAVCAVIGVGTVLATIGAVWLVNGRPARAALSTDGQEAWLLSASGNQLHRWKLPGFEHSRRFVELVRRPPSLGGGRVVVLSGPSDDPSLMQQLRVYSLNDLETPIWSTGDAAHVVSWPPDQPPQPRDTFCANGVVLADVFPDLPGKEIVVSHTQMHSLCLIRVYDLNGKVLYGVWHDGVTNELYWMSGPGILTCYGCDSQLEWYERGKAFDWSRFGMKGPPEDSWPRVIYAVRPEAGKQAGLINGPDRDPRAVPVWYRYIGPPWASDLLRGHLEAPVAPRLQQDHVVLALFTDDGTGNVSMFIDSHGREDGPRVPNDAFRRFHAGQTERLYLSDEALGDPSH